MLEVTEPAKEWLKNILVEQNVKDPQAAMRIVIEPSGELRFCIDIEFSEDQVIDYKGSAVLRLAPEVAKRLEGKILDVKDFPDGPDFALIPKEKK
ncbi:MAG TPA: hypothetical protein VMW61_05010 [Dehalococcoidales bacterium]|nr:hypothetical protein [Dehalococcoidales bacterium]